ncbi:sporulation protein [Bacillaceae bacterium]
MNLFKKILASIGIGSAKVDTVLTQPEVRVGETLAGEIHIAGGEVEQSIAQIYMTLFTHYYHETDDRKTKQRAVLTSFKASGPLTVNPGEKRSIPFSFTVPYHTPVTIGKQQVYLSTGLDIDMAVDPTDLDPVIVRPDPLVARLFAEMDDMGFRHSHDSGICKYQKRFRSQVPFVQEFEWKPTRMFRNELDEIEMIFDVRPEGVDVLMQVDKRARGLVSLLEEALDLDERYVRFFLDRRKGAAPGELENLIRRTLSRRG